MGALIESGTAGRAFPGETVSGDRATVLVFPQGVLAAVIDGLGHGTAASEAADSAVGVLQSRAEEPPETLLRYCHEALRGKRGAAMSLASINARGGIMAWLGVGNVDSLLLRLSASPPMRETLMTRGGVVGYQLPPLRTRCLPVAAGDLLIFTTDGIRSDFATGVQAADPLLRCQPVQEIADRLLLRFGKHTDDALVLVIRYLGIIP